MKQSLLTILRDENTSRTEFRRAARLLSQLMAMESASHFKKKEVELQTPLEKAKGFVFETQIVVVPILRAGLAMLPSFLDVYPEAKVGFIGMSRNEETFEPEHYYNNLPHLDGTEEVVLIDPMIATGGSATAAIESLITAGVPEGQISLVSIIAAPEGIQSLQRGFPGLHIHVAQIDRELNADKFIVPGLGDFGDRYCGT